jgi:hypothetical protein
MRTAAPSRRRDCVELGRQERRISEVFGDLSQQLIARDAQDIVDLEVREAKRMVCLLVRVVRVHGVQSIVAQGDSFSRRRRILVRLVS